MAIANPSQELLVSCALAADLLLAKEGSDLRYIEYANLVTENRARREAAQVSGTAAPTVVTSPSTMQSSLFSPSENARARIVSIIS